ncbi:MAG: nicotinate phosphoribosyltransferase, partial [Clostridia bacterium]|nr:nicotinate phosphoribosyltransferase [Clostridia bacterium]
KIFDKGKCVYESPDLKTIQNKCREEIETLWDEVKRFENPHRYYVDLSKDMWQMKQNLLDQFG